MGLPTKELRAQSALVRTKHPFNRVYRTLKKAYRKHGAAGIHAAIFEYKMREMYAEVAIQKRMVKKQPTRMFGGGKAVKHPAAKKPSLFVRFKNWITRMVSSLF
ncbi:MAG: hypothetical protein AAGH79_08500 [Bacteroidota bacterium]